MSKLFRIFFIFLAIIIILVIAFFTYFFIGKPKVQKGITWGVDFSQSQAEYLKINWKETYLAIINDLRVKNIKLHTNWNWVEGKQDNYYFNDIDWQIKQAEQKNVKIIYVLGIKTGRWPECHIPFWAQNLTKSQQQTELLKYITEVVRRYKSSKAISYWQVENEPLFRFGKCPNWYYQDDSFLRTEVNLVKSLDPARQVIISDSGEQSAWFGAAQIGDIVGATMYRNAWAQVTNTFGFNASYSFLNPTVYSRKANIIKQLFGKKLICIELQAEPWTSSPFLEAPLDEQIKSMNPVIFKENIEFAKDTGFDTFYLWGAEWWYWMKTKNNYPQIWDQAEQLFK